MKNRIQSVIKYIVMLGITIFLLWISLKNIKVAEGESRWDYILGELSTANNFYLFLSAVAILVSHLTRAERWRLLLLPIGHNNVKLSESFMSVMVGYFINLAIPRGGELSRCYNLYRLRHVPVNVSFGTVISERIIDLLFLIIFITVSFFIELDSLVYFFTNVDFGAEEGGGTNNNLLYYLLATGVLVFTGLLVFILVNRNSYRIRKVRSKVRSLWLGMRNGLLAVFRLEKKKTFIFYSFFIWFLYYLMNYLVMMAFPETANLGMLPALTIFVIGGIAMAMPLPGGAGSYHILVPAGLVMLYGLGSDKATAFAIIIHGWQTVVHILVGAISLLVSQSLYKRKPYAGKNRA